MREGIGLLPAIGEAAGELGVEALVGHLRRFEIQTVFNGIVPADEWPPQRLLSCDLVQLLACRPQPQQVPWVLQLGRDDGEYLGRHRRQSLCSLQKFWR